MSNMVADCALDTHTFPYGLRSESFKLIQTQQEVNCDIIKKSSEIKGVDHYFWHWHSMITWPLNDYFNFASTITC